MKLNLWFALLVPGLISYVATTEPIEYPCSSEIYCHGPLLHTVQMARIHEDSKTFVDMKLKKPPNETLIKFNEFMVEHGNKPETQDVAKFVLNNFDPAGEEFQVWDPLDWHDNPKFVDRIQDPEFKLFASKLNEIWKTLGRKIKDEVKEHSELYSIIWVPHPIIVPGGRFREFYYWDTYWIVIGLLLSEMYETTRGMLENLLYMVDNYGHIPNGGRLYYLARSQPPLLIPMVKKYYDATQDIKFLKAYVKTMEAEFEYWQTNHTVVINMDGKNYTLAHYGDRSQGPRPESYSEDVAGSVHFSEGKKEGFYSELKAAAESGWDFSSRWFIVNGTDSGNLTNIKTRSIIPVDLNAFLQWNAALLAEFHKILNNVERSKIYQNIADEYQEAITAVLWHEEVGIWLDYDISNNVKRDYFYPTNVAPLYTGCMNQTHVDRVTHLVLKYLHNKHIMNSPGGIPSTMRHTGEQWDYPNAWPPLQHMMIIALNNTGDKAAKRLAFEIAQNWVRSNHKSFKKHHVMMEKYDATVAGASGSGGEYSVQEGFGWTNGVMMDLLDKYSDTLFTKDPEALTMMANPAVAASGSVTTALLALLVSLTAGFIGICIYKRRLGQMTKNAQVSRPRVRYTELKNMRQGQ